MSFDDAKKILSSAGLRSFLVRSPNLTLEGWTFKMTLLQESNHIFLNFHAELTSILLLLR
jgi:hypothetical protein